MDNQITTTQVHQDWDRARLKAFWARVADALMRRPGELVPLDEVKKRLKIRGSHYRGLQHVPLNQIIGSEGRYADFDRRFLPRQAGSATRWMSIDSAQYNDINLPPVELYKIGDVYFVKDGNHRVSVARQHGRQDIDAYVTEYVVDVPLDLSLSMRDLLLKEEYSDFLDWTDLARMRPEQRTELSELGGYGDLVHHINTHRYYLAIERSAPVSHDEAVASWYDNVYMPVVTAIGKHALLRSFPGRTEADLYLWIMQHRATMLEHAGADPGAEAATLDYVRHNQPRSLLGTVGEAIQTLAGAALALTHTEKTGPAELADFIEWARLDVLCPEVEIELTDPADFARLRKHIEDHQYYLGTQRHRAVSRDEAVVDWCAVYFAPTVQAIHDGRLQLDQRHQTAADLYLEVMDQLAQLKGEGAGIGLSEAIAAVAERQQVATPRPGGLRGFMRWFQRRPAAGGV